MHDNWEVKYISKHETGKPCIWTEKKQHSNIKYSHESPPNTENTVFRIVSVISANQGKLFISAWFLSWLNILL